jgi:rare lipoprotein A
MSRQRWQFALAGLLCTIAVTPISATQLSVGQRGQASWYGEFHEGKLMANQRPFRMDEATVAHRTLPLGTLIEVRNLKNGRFVDAEVTDRGPYVRGRMLDVSKAVAEELEMLEGGTAAVEIRVIQLGG